MGMHSRLGAGSPLTALNNDALSKILKHIQGPPHSLHEAIRMDLELRFPGLLPEWASDMELFKGSDASCGASLRVACVVDRLRSFTRHLSASLGLEGIDAVEENGLRSANLYLKLLARQAGAVYVSVESGTSALVIEDGARGSGDDCGFDSAGWLATTAAPGTPCLVLAPDVLDRVSEYILQGKEALLQDLVAKVCALLETHHFRAVWLVRGGYNRAAGLRNSTWVTVQTEWDGKLVTGIVLDATTQTPSLGDLMLPSSMAQEVTAHSAFSRILGDGRFMQRISAEGAH